MNKEKIKEILKKIKGDYFDFEENLLTGGYISSFDLIEIIAGIEKTFDIKIPLSELRPEDFDSIDGICGVLERYDKSQWKGISE